MTNQTQGHTPKWKVKKSIATTLHNEKNVLWQIEDDTCNPIALLGNDKETNANFIVTACNSHYELLEALKNAIISIQIMKLPQRSGVASNEQILEIMKQSFEQAIANAEGKG